jgi:hypothetical protein
MKSKGSGLKKSRLMAVGTHKADHTTSLYLQKLALKFIYQRRSLTPYSSLAD